MVKVYGGCVDTSSIVLVTTPGQISHPNLKGKHWQVRQDIDIDY